MSSTRDFIELHFIVLIWGVTAILGLLITIPPIELVFYRTAMAFLALGALLAIRGISASIPGRDIMGILGTGGLIALHWILFFGSARISNASVCLAGMATCSLWTSLLEPILTRKKFKPYEMGLGIFVILGIYVIYRVEVDYVEGLLMALGSAFVAALFTVINSKYTKRVDPFVITFYEMGGAAIACALFFPFYLLLPEVEGLQLVPTAMDWVYITILSLVCTVFAYSASVRLMKRISAFAINLVINMEPVYGIILAYLVFGDKERMAGGFYLGTLIILIAVLSYPFLNRYYQQRSMGVDNLR
jgi:drug/metabolite transporter (DMT)-like permease